MEPENSNDDGQWWQIIADVIEDFTEQQVPGSVVLVILGVVMFREATGFYLKLRGKRE